MKEKRFTGEAKLLPPKGESPTDVLINAMSFLLALGFNNPDDTAVKLVVKSFEPVHKAAESNDLSDYSWSLLNKFAPSISWSGDWDKCARLRNALIDRFINFKWSKEDFLICLNNSELFQKVVWQIMDRSYLFGLDSQHKFLVKTAKKVLSHKIAATIEQKRILAIYMDED